MEASKVETPEVDMEQPSAEVRGDEVATGPSPAWETQRRRKRKARSATDATEDMPLEGAAKRPSFPPAATTAEVSSDEVRKIPVPAHRFTPLRDAWAKLFSPLVENLHLKVRFNLKTRNVELKASGKTTDVGALQKGADFVRAFTLGFEVEDSLALVRLDDLFLDSFDVNDVKPLHGDHLSRAIGRVAGKGGKTKFTIENVTKTRIVLADSKVHILGSYQNIQIAKRSICNLILGSPPSKVYGNMRAVASRSAERF